MMEEMKKPAMVTLHYLNWYLLLALFEQVLNMDNVFATEQDREACRETFKSIHNQVYNKEDKSLIDLLTIPPKKIITMPDIIM